MFPLLQKIWLISRFYVVFFKVEYLRKFSKLQMLALKGNPLSLQSDYSSYVIAFIPSLIYIDFRIIREDEVRYGATR